MLDIQNNKRQGSSGGLSSRPSQISLIRRNEGINHNELKRSSSPASNLRGMSADAAERWSNKPKPASNLRGMSADAAERWSNKPKPASNLRGMSADAAERWSNKPKPTSNLRGMSADAAERWSNKPKPASNLRGMSADAAERWSNSANSRGTYNIRSGDTLSAIAQRELGSSSRWREIKKPDGSSFSTSEASRLRVGQQISLPGTSSSTNNHSGGGNSKIRRMSANGAERWSNSANSQKPTQNLRGMSPDAAERWSGGSRTRSTQPSASSNSWNNVLSGIVRGSAITGFVASRRLSPVPTEASRAAKPLVLSATLPDGSNSIREIPLRRVRFSQGGVSPSLRNGIPLSQVVEGMRKNGWDYTAEPPDVVRFEGRNLSIRGRRIPIGRSQYVSLDNRRIVAARQAGSIRQIPARIHSENAPIRHNIPSEPGHAGTAEANRFKLKKVRNIEGNLTEVRYTDPKTGINHQNGSRPKNWGEAVMHRGASQRVRGYENFPLKGTRRLPEIETSGSRLANTTSRTVRAVGESRAASVALRGVSRIAAPVAIGLDAWQLKDAYQQDGFGQEFRKEAGRVAGGWGGAAAGAAGGAAIGSVVPVVGTTAGAIVGGVIGGVAGSEFGDDIEQGAEKAGQAIADGAKNAWNKLNPFD